ncbi:hypothetical protein R1flu_023110 [Riccia fluitans]|uniref:Uncharacterized protein n=1 Tax=Riccia fluitans TaxID=41844 RepID=A0ABD1XRU4_9MARC
MVEILLAGRSFRKFGSHLFCEHHLGQAVVCRQPNMEDDTKLGSPGANRTYLKRVFLPAKGMGGAQDAHIGASYTFGNSTHEAAKKFILFYGCPEVKYTEATGVDIWTVNRATVI